MGKPISAANKYPFTIGGIKVDKANIFGQIATIDLYIYKQRSDTMFDLIDINGNVYQFIELVWYDVDGVELDSSVLPADANIKNNSFIVLEDDGISKGYAMHYQYHKIKLNNNLIAYRDPHEVFVHVDGVTVSPKTLSATVGDLPGQLTATVTPLNASVKSVAWSSSAPAICTVDSTGKVTYVAAGSATITASTTDGAKTDTCDVTVAAAVINVTSVTVAPKTLTGTVGGTGNLTATVAPSNATDQTVTWSTSDDTICTVSSAGVVTYVAPGTATVTCTSTDGAKTDTCDVTVS